MPRQAVSLRASVLTYPMQGQYPMLIMARNDPPQTIGELIDRIDLIREELLGIQRSMEKSSPESQ
jgi:hypothetical protein